MVEWSKETDMAAIQMLCDGFRTETVAERLHCAMTTLTARCRNKLGYTAQEIRSLHKKGMTAGQILETCHPYKPHQPEMLFPALEPASANDRLSKALELCAELGDLLAALKAGDK